MAIWNSSKVIPEVAKTTLEDSRSKAKVEAPIAVKMESDETAPQETSSKLYIHKLED